MVHFMVPFFRLLFTPYLAEKKQYINVNLNTTIKYWARQRKKNAEPAKDLKRALLLNLFSTFLCALSGLCGLFL